MKLFQNAYRKVTSVKSRSALYIYTHTTYSIVLIHNMPNAQYVPLKLNKINTITKTFNDDFMHNQKQANHNYGRRTSRQFNILIPHKKYNYIYFKWRDDQKPKVSSNFFLPQGQYSRSVTYRITWYMTYNIQPTCTYYTYYIPTI